MEWPAKARLVSWAANPGDAEELAHDARNLLAAMGLYCDLLSQPGVLNRRYAHYAEHLRVVVDSGLSLVGRLLSTSGTVAVRAIPAGGLEADAGLKKPAAIHGLQHPAMIGERTFLADVGAETERRRGMLSVLVGPRIALEIDCLPGAGLIRLEPVDLGRILVNLVRNAGEAMPGGGRVRISVQKGAGLSFVPGVVPWVGHDLVPALRAREPLLPRPGGKGRNGDQTVLLCVQDNGPGIAPEFSSPC